MMVAARMLAAVAARMLRLYSAMTVSSTKHIWVPGEKTSPVF